MEGVNKFFDLFLAGNKFEQWKQQRSETSKFGEIFPRIIPFENHKTLNKIFEISKQKN